MSQNASSSTKAITPKAVLSYPHLHQPQAGKPGQKPKYSASLVFTPESLKDPKERAVLDLLKAAAVAAADAKYPGKGAEMLRTQKLRSPFRTDAEAKGYPEGSTFINVRTEQKPGVVHAYAGPDGKPAKMDEGKVKEEMYPGAIVRASLNAFCYDTDGNRGVSFALNNLQKLADGERLDGRVSAENEFDADLSAAPADLSSLGV